MDAVPDLSYTRTKLPCCFWGNSLIMRSGRCNARPCLDLASLHVRPGGPPRYSGGGGLRLPGCSDPTSQSFQVGTERQVLTLSRECTAGSLPVLPPRVQGSRQGRRRAKALPLLPLPLPRCPQALPPLRRDRALGQHCPVPPTKLVCTHCVSQGRPGQGHLIKSCFSLHPHLRPQRSAGQGSGRALAASAGPCKPHLGSLLLPQPADTDSVSGSGTLSDEQLPSSCPNWSRHSWPQWPIMMTTTTAVAPWRGAQLPRQLRPRSYVQQQHANYHGVIRELPAEADHNRVGRPPPERLPLGFLRVNASEQPDSEGELSPSDELPDALNCLQSAQMYLHRAMKRVTFHASRQGSISAAPASS